MTSELQSGYQVPAYAYARNNPVNTTDPTGLMAWIEYCEGGGIRVEPKIGGGFNVTATSMSVQFNTGNRDCVDDENLALKFERQYVKSGPYSAYKECWRRLIRQIRAGCPDGVQPVPPAPQPPRGYCSAN